MPESGESKRLQIVFKDYGGDTRSFAKLFDMTQPSLIRMMKGDQPINIKVIKVVCNQLSYSAEWFINGTGAKKRAAKDNELKLKIHK